MNISLKEVEINKYRIASVIFKKEEYTFEGMIRWLMDRELMFDNFYESERYYIFRQPCRQSFECFEYRKIGGEFIGIELGLEGKDGQTDLSSIDERIDL